MNCIIIDDEAAARILIEQYCIQHKITVVKEFSNAVDALKWMNENKVDLIFLDLHMPSFSGIDFVKSIKNPPNIIITTSDPNFAVEAFNFHFIIGYLLKPVTLTDFHKIIKKLEVISAIGKNSSINLKSTKKDLFVNIDKRLIKIVIEDITIIQAKGDFIEIKTAKETFKVNTALKNMRDKLPEDLFFQIHRSYIINLTKIIDIELNSVLINKEVIPIGRSKKAELMNLLNLL